MESLTEKVLQYQKTRAGLEEIVKEVSPRVYQFPRRKMEWDEDACGEFYLYFHPRLLRLIGRFQDQGKPFESYLCSIMGWQLRNFARERRRGEREWNVSLRLEPGDGCATEDGCATGGLAPESADGGREEERASVPPEIAALIRSGADRKNFLFLVLKCCRAIDPQRAALLAPIAGVSPERLRGLVGALKDMRAARERRLEIFRDRRNRAFARTQILESELAAEVDPKRREALQAALGRMRLRMRSAMDRMARVGTAPTNKEIAMALGVPKGTVDSGLYWLKRKLAPVYDPDHLRFA